MVLPLPGEPWKRTLRKGAPRSFALRVDSASVSTRFDRLSFITIDRDRLAASAAAWPPFDAPWLSAAAMRRALKEGKEGWGGEG